MKQQPNQPQTKRSEQDAMVLFWCYWSCGHSDADSPADRPEYFHVKPSISTNIVTVLENA